MPSKSLLASAAAFRVLKNAAEFGLSDGKIGFDFSKIAERTDWTVSQIAGPRLGEYFAMQGIDIIGGSAGFISSHEVAIDGRTVSFNKAIIATGSEPYVPQIDGLDEVGYITSDQAVSARDIPDSVIIVGGSSVGLEFANVYESFDSQVTIVDAADRIAIHEDREVSEALYNYITGRGINIYASSQIQSAFKDGTSKAMTVKTPDGEVVLKAEELLIATGRRAVTTGLNLKGIGVKAGEHGIEVNDYLQTSIDTVYAAGDVIPGLMLAQAAAYEGDLAAKNALGKTKSRVSYRVIPRATWSNPVVANVGLTEDEAQQEGRDYIVTKFFFAGLARALTSGERIGFVKIIGDIDSDEVVGFHVIGHHADELVHEGVLAMQARIKIAELANANHLEMTMAEGIGDAFIDLHDAIQRRKRKAA